MKPPTAAAMIIMGTVLILAPIGADYLFQRNLVALMLKEQSTSATVIPQLSTWYRVVCWLTGSLMVMVGALGAIADSRARFYVAPDDEIEEEDEEDES